MDRLKQQRESEYLSQGLCVRGCGNPVDRRSRYCLNCRQARNVGTKKSYKLRRQNGLCTICGLPGAEKACHYECARDMAMKRKYGIGLVDYERMYTEQNGKCAICGKDKARLVIDHDHKTGKIRKLLCYKCNLLIGVLELNQDLLNLGFEYIKLHK